VEEEILGAKKNHLAEWLQVQDRCDYAVRMALDAADTVPGNALTQEELLRLLWWAKLLMGEWI